MRNFHGIIRFHIFFRNCCRNQLFIQKRWISTNNNTSIISFEHVTNARSSIYRSLTKKSDDFIIVEGYRHLLSIEQQWKSIDKLIIRSDICGNREQIHNIITTSTNPSLPIYVLPPLLFDRLSSFDSPPGYLAHFRIPKNKIHICKQKLNINNSNSELIPFPDWSIRTVICDNLRDPVNIGSTMRSCSAFGIKQLILIDSVDIFNRKIINTSAGTIANFIKILQYSRENFNLFITKKLIKVKQINNIHLIALTIKNGIKPEHAAKKDSNNWIVVGNESNGLSADMLSICDVECTLPISSNVESLNAGVATAIAAYIIAQK